MHFRNVFFHKAVINEIYIYLKKSYFVYLSGKPMIPHLPRYQGLAVDDYGFTLDASNMGHRQLSFI